MTDAQYDAKFKEMQKYIPFIQKVIEKLKVNNDQQGDNPRKAQLQKMEMLHGLLTNQAKKLKMETLLKCEGVLKKLHAKIEKHSTFLQNDEPDAPKKTLPATTKHTQQTSACSSTHVGKPKPNDKCIILAPASPSPERCIPDDDDDDVQPVVIPTERRSSTDSGSKVKLASSETISKDHKSRSSDNRIKHQHSQKPQHSVNSPKPEELRKLQETRERSFTNSPELRSDVAMASRIDCLPPSLAKLPYIDAHHQSPSDRNSPLSHHRISKDLHHHSTSRHQQQNVHKKGSNPSSSKTNSSPILQTVKVVITEPLPENLAKRHFPPHHQYLYQQQSQNSPPAREQTRCLHNIEIKPAEPKVFPERKPTDEEAYNPDESWEKYNEGQKNSKNKPTAGVFTRLGEKVGSEEPLAAMLLPKSSPIDIPGRSSSIPDVLKSPPLSVNDISNLFKETGVEYVSTDISEIGSRRPKKPPVEEPKNSLDYVRKKFAQIAKIGSPQTRESTSPSAEVKNIEKNSPLANSPAPLTSERLALKYNPHPRQERLQSLSSNDGSECSQQSATRISAKPNDPRLKQKMQASPSSLPPVGVNVLPSINANDPRLKRQSSLNTTVNNIVIPTSVIHPPPPLASCYPARQDPRIARQFSEPVRRMSISQPYISTEENWDSEPEDHFKKNDPRIPRGHVISSTGPERQPQTIPPVRRKSICQTSEFPSTTVINPYAPNPPKDDSEENWDSDTSTKDPINNNINRNDSRLAWDMQRLATSQPIPPNRRKSISQAREFSDQPFISNNSNPDILKVGWNSKSDALPNCMSRESSTMNRNSTSTFVPFGPQSTTHQPYLTNPYGNRSQVPNTTPPPLVPFSSQSPFMPAGGGNRFNSLVNDSKERIRYFQSKKQQQPRTYKEFKEAKEKAQALEAANRRALEEVQATANRKIEEAEAAKKKAAEDKLKKDSLPQDKNKTQSESEKLKEKAAVPAGESTLDKMYRTQNFTTQFPKASLSFKIPKKKSEETPTTADVATKEAPKKKEEKILKAPDKSVDKSKEKMNTTNNQKSKKAAGQKIAELTPKPKIESIIPNPPKDDDTDENWDTDTDSNEPVSSYKSVNKKKSESNKNIEQTSEGPKVKPSNVESEQLKENTEKSINVRDPRCRPKEIAKPKTGREQEKDNDITKTEENVKGDQSRASQNTTANMKKFLDETSSLSFSPNAELKPQRITRRRCTMVSIGSAPLVDRDKLMKANALMLEDIEERDKLKRKKEEEERQIMRRNKHLEEMFQKTDDNCTVSTQNIITGKRRTRASINFNETQNAINVFKHIINKKDVPPTPSPTAKTTRSRAKAKAVEDEKTSVKEENLKVSSDDTEKHGKCGKSVESDTESVSRDSIKVKTGIKKIKVAIKNEKMPAKETELSQANDKKISEATPKSENEEEKDTNVSKKIPDEKAKSLKEEMGKNVSKEISDEKTIFDNEEMKETNVSQNIPDDKAKSENVQKNTNVTKTALEDKVKDGNEKVKASEETKTISDEKAAATDREDLNDQKGPKTTSVEKAKTDNENKSDPNMANKISDGKAKADNDEEIVPKGSETASIGKSKSESEDGKDKAAPKNSSENKDDKGLIAANTASVEKANSDLEKKKNENVSKTISAEKDTVDIDGEKDIKVPKAATTEKSKSESKGGMDITVPKNTSEESEEENQANALENTSDEKAKSDKEDENGLKVSKTDNETKKTASVSTKHLNDKATVDNEEEKGPTAPKATSAEKSKSQSQEEKQENVLENTSDDKAKSGIEDEQGLTTLNTTVDEESIGSENEKKNRNVTKNISVEVTKVSSDEEKGSKVSKENSAESITSTNEEEKQTNLPKNTSAENAKFGNEDGKGLKIPKTVLDEEDKEDIESKKNASVSKNTRVVNAKVPSDGEKDPKVPKKTSVGNSKSEYEEENHANVFKNTSDEKAKSGNKDEKGLKALNTASDEEDKSDNEKKKENNMLKKVSVEKAKISSDEQKGPKVSKLAPDEKAKPSNEDKKNPTELKNKSDNKEEKDVPTSKIISDEKVKPGNETEKAPECSKGEDANSEVQQNKEKKYLEINEESSKLKTQTKKGKKVALKLPLVNKKNQRLGAKKKTTGEKEDEVPSTSKATTPTPSTAEELESNATLHNTAKSTIDEEHQICAVSSTSAELPAEENTTTTVLPRLKEEVDDNEPSSSGSKSSNHTPTPPEDESSRHAFLNDFVQEIIKPNADKQHILSLLSQILSEDKLEIIKSVIDSTGKKTDEDKDEEEDAATAKDKDPEQTKSNTKVKNRNQKRGRKSSKAIKHEVESEPEDDEEQEDNDDDGDDQDDHPLALLRNSKSGRNTPAVRRKRNELDRLNDDIRDMFICQGVLTATGKRMCTLMNQRNPKTEAEISPNKRFVQPTPPVVKIEIETNNKRRSGRIKTPTQPVRRSLRGGKTTEQSSDKGHEDEVEITTYSGNSDLTDDSTDTTPTRRKMPVLKPHTPIKLPEEAEVETITGDNNNKRKSLNKPGPKSKKTKLTVVTKNTKKDSDIEAESVTTESEDESGKEETTELDTIKNTNVHWHNQSKYTTWCKLCSKKIPANSCSFHYKMHHGENYISRLAPVLVQKFKQGKLCKPLFGVDRSPKQWSWFHRCPFCLQYFNTTMPLWLEHFQNHTAEFRYECSKCHWGSNRMATTKSHITRMCKGATVENSVVKLAVPTVIKAHVCHLCNFLQLKRANLERHYLEQHLLVHKNVDLLGYAITIFDCGNVESVAEDKAQAKEDEARELIAKEEQVIDVDADFVANDEADDEKGKTKEEVVNNDMEKKVQDQKTELEKGKSKTLKEKQAKENIKAESTAEKQNPTNVAAADSTEEEKKQDETAAKQKSEEEPKAATDKSDNIKVLGTKDSKVTAKTDADNLIENETAKTKEKAATFATKLTSTEALSPKTSTKVAKIVTPTKLQIVAQTTTPSPKISVAKVLSPTKVQIVTAVPTTTPTKLKAASGGTPVKPRVGAVTATTKQPSPTKAQITAASTKSGKSDQKQVPKNINEDEISYPKTIDVDDEDEQDPLLIVNEKELNTILSEKSPKKMLSPKKVTEAQVTTPPTRSKVAGKAAANVEPPTTPISTAAKPMPSSSPSVQIAAKKYTFSLNEPNSLEEVITPNKRNNTRPIFNCEIINKDIDVKEVQDELLSLAAAAAAEEHDNTEEVKEINNDNKSAAARYQELVNEIDDSRDVQDELLSLAAQAAAAEEEKELMEHKENTNHPSSQGSSAAFQNATQTSDSVDMIFHCNKRKSDENVGEQDDSISKRHCPLDNQTSNVFVSSSELLGTNSPPIQILAQSIVNIEEQDKAMDNTNQPNTTTTSIAERLSQRFKVQLEEKTCRNNQNDNENNDKIQEVSNDTMEKKDIVIDTAEKMQSQPQPNTARSDEVTVISDDEDWEDIEITESAPNTSTNHLQKSKNKGMFQKFGPFKGNPSKSKKHSMPPLVFLSKKKPTTKEKALQQSHSNSSSPITTKSNSSNDKSIAGSTMPAVQHLGFKPVINIMEDLLPDSPCNDPIDLVPELRPLEPLTDLNDISSILESNLSATLGPVGLQMDESHTCIQDALDFICEQAANEEQSHKPLAKTDQVQLKTPSKNQIQNVGYSQHPQKENSIKFYCLLENCSFLFSSDAMGLENHFFCEHAQIKWKGYCNLCQTQCLPNDQEYSISKEIRHMVEKHVNRPIEPNSDSSQHSASAGQGGGGGGEERPRIKLRRMTGDCLSTSNSESPTPSSSSAPTTAAVQSSNTLLGALLNAKPKPPTKDMPPQPEMPLTEPLLLDNTFTNVSNDFVITSVTSASQAERPLQIASVMSLNQQPESTSLPKIANVCTLSSKSAGNMWSQQIEDERQELLESAVTSLEVSNILANARNPSYRRERTRRSRDDSPGPIVIAETLPVAQATAGDFLITQTVSTQYGGDTTAAAVGFNISIQPSVLSNLTITNSEVPPNNMDVANILESNAQSTTPRTHSPLVVTDSIPPLQLLNVPPTNNSHSTTTPPVTSRQYKCTANGCKFTTRVPVAMSDHLRFHERRNLSLKCDYFSCAFCSYQANDVEDYMKHSDQYHIISKGNKPPTTSMATTENETVAPSVSRNICDILSKKMESANRNSGGGLAEAQRNAIIKQKETEEEYQKKLRATIDEIVGPTGFPDDKLYRCVIKTCRTHLTESTFHNHILFHISTLGVSNPNNYIFKCPHCTAQYHRPAGIKAHIKNHARNRYFCYLCEETSSNPGQMLKHFSDKHWHTLTMYTKELLKAKVITNADGTDQIQDSCYYLVYTNDLSEAEVRSYGEKLILEWQRKKSGSKTHFKSSEIDLLPIPPIYQREVNCGECEYKTKVRTNMYRHLLMHKQNAQLPSGQSVVASVDPVNPVPCLNSSEKFFDKMTNLASSSLIPSSSSQSSSNSNGANKLPYKIPQAFIVEADRFKCGISDCNYVTISEDIFRSHLSTLHGSAQSYRCPFCQEEICKRGMSVDRVINHFRYHSSILYRCEECNYLHYQRFIVERHINEKHSSLKVNLVRHERTEENVEGTAMTTSIIGKKYKDNTDTNQTPASSSSTSTVTPATRSSTGAADTSTKSSNNSSSSANNNTKGKGKWLCDICKHKASTVGQIQTHCQNAHGQNKPYQCMHCQFGSQQLSQILYHIDENHPGKTRNARYIYHKMANDEDIDDADTRPLWQRNDPTRIRHIRGILMEDEEESEKHRKKLGLDKVIDDDDENEEEEDATEASSSHNFIKGFEFGCFHCDYKSEKFDELYSTHYKNVHSSPLEMTKPFMFRLLSRVCCPECRKFTGNFYEMQIHLKNVHYERNYYAADITIAENEDNSQRIVCGYCSFHCLKPDQLMKHFRTAKTLHSPQDVHIENQSQILDILKLGTNQSYFQCTLCNQIFGSRISIVQHAVNSHVNDEGFSFKEITNEVIYQCPLCPFSSTTETTLLRHMIDHYGRFKRCHFCYFEQNSFEQYMQHCYAAHRDDIGKFRDIYPYAHIKHFLQQMFILFPNGLVVSKLNLFKTNYGCELVIQEHYEEMYKISQQPPIPRLSIARLVARKSIETHHRQTSASSSPQHLIDIVTNEDAVFTPTPSTSQAKRITKRRCTVMASGFEENNSVDNNTVASSSSRKLGSNGGSGSKRKSSVTVENESSSNQSGEFNVPLVQAAMRIKKRRRTVATDHNEKGQSPYSSSNSPQPQTQYNNPDSGDVTYTKLKISDVTSFANSMAPETSNQQERAQPLDLEYFSFYGIKPEPLDLSKIYTKVAIGGINTPLTIDKFRLLFNIDCRLKLTKCDDIYNAGAATGGQPPPTYLQYKHIKKACPASHKLQFS